MIRKLKVLLSLAAMALAVVSARATDIAVSSGGYDYRLYDINGGSDPHADVTGETAGYTGVVLPTLPAFIKYRGYTFPLRNIPEGKTIGASLGELVVVGDGTDVITNTYERENISLRRVTISGIAKIEGAGSPSGYGYVGAFARCHNLQYIDFLGDALGEIEGNCFTECENLRAVVIPDSVTNIANRVFADCPSVTNIVVGAGLPVIYHGQLPSYYTTNLMEVTINGSGRTVLEGSEDATLHRDGDGTFAGTAVRRVVLRGVASIGNGEAFCGVFSDCTNLTEIVFADNCLTNICRGSFRRCSKLKHVTLPESLKRLGQDAFLNCTSLTDIDFGTGEYAIETAAFSGCTALENVNITAALKPYSSGSIFQGCTNIASLRIGPCVTNITSQFVPYAFAGIYRRPFEAVIDGAGKTEIATQAFKSSTLRCIRLKGVRSIGTQAFYESKQLESVDFVDCPLESIGEGAFMLCGKLGSLDLPNTSSTEIYTDAFRDCVALTNFTFGSGACTLNGATHFRNCTSLRNFRYEDGVTMPGVSTYGWWPLAGCTSITNVYVGKGLTTIGQNINPANTTNAFDLTIAGAGEAVIDAAAFRDSKVRRVKLVGVKSIGDEAFNRCKLLESLEFADCPKLEYIGAAAFASCSLLGSVALPDAESTTIANQAFRLCTGMTTFTFGTGEYQFTGGWHFGSCTSLTSMTLPDGAKDAGEPLYDCTAITNLVIGTGVESVSSNLKPGGNKVLESVTVNGNGEAVIGAAFMRDMSSVKHVVLKGVMRIEDEAFIRCSGLETVEVTGGGLESIGRAAFAECSNLASVTLPDSPSLAIANSAFYRCSGLSGFSLPPQTVSIGENAFYQCSSLTELAIPDSLTSIGNTAFKNCANLVDIDFGEGEYTLGNSVFSGCSALKDISLTATIPTYGSSVFAYCTSVTNLYIGPGITNITAGIAAKDAEDLRYVTIDGNGDAVISGPAFRYNNMRFVIMSGVKAIGTFDSSSAFEGCEDLFCVVVKDDALKTIGRSAFNDCGGLAYPSLGDSVEEIGPYAFYACDNISENYLCLPASLKKIGESAFAYCKHITEVTIPAEVQVIPESAFANCTDLQSVTFPENLKEIGATAFTYCSSLDDVVVPNSVTNVGNRAFSYCSGMTSLSLSDGMETIRNGLCLNCGDLESVKLPLSLKQIEQDAFKWCSALTTVSFPDSLTSVGVNAFYGCSSLADVDFGAGSYTLGQGVFSYCSSLEAVDLTANITSYGNNVFYYCSNIAEMRFGPGVTNITSDLLPTPSSKLANLKRLTVEGNGNAVWTASILSHGNLEEVNISGVREIVASAFSGCESLTNVTFSGTDLQLIGDYAFYGCTALSQIVIPDSVSSMNFAFANCTALTNAVVGAGVTVMTNAFQDCSALATVEIRDGVQEISPYAFNQCDSLKTVAVPGSVKSVCDRAFYHCDALQSATLAEGVETIGKYVFARCPLLETVTIPSTVISIGSDTFWHCYSLQAIDVAAGNTSYSSTDGVLFNVDKSELLLCPKAKTGKYQVPDTVTVLHEAAFEECGALTDITLPEGLTIIGNYCFDYCWSLRKLTIPSTVSSIGNYYALTRCSSMQKIEVAEGNETYSATNGVLLSNGGTTLFQVPGGIQNVCTIPEGVVEVTEWAFLGCEGISTLSIPSTLTAVNVAQLPSVDAFEVAADNAAYSSGNGALLSKDGTLFWLCPARRTGSYEIPSGVITVKEGALQTASANSLTEIVFPASVTTIEANQCYRFWCTVNDVVFKGLPPTVDAAAYIDQMQNGYYLANHDEWDAVITDGKWQGLAMSAAATVDESETGGRTIYVPESWLDDLESTYGAGTSDEFVSRFGNDFEAALIKATGKTSSSGASMKVWEDFVAGTDPTDEDSKFMAKIEIVDGVPVVTWEPALNGEGISNGVRSYKTYGTKKLGDECDWKLVGYGEESDYNFFNVTVEMP